MVTHHGIESVERGCGLPDEVRAFIAENYPAEMRVPNPETDLTKEQSLLWHRIIYRKGWVALSWPSEYGGPAWTISQRYIFEQETSPAETLPPLPFGVTMVGPVIYTFGNEAQKKKFLPRILSGDDWWCQGYSEPGAGLVVINIQYGDPAFHTRRCAEDVFGLASRRPHETTTAAPRAAHAA
jgi:alkylation response protein AidB-like acyl-CoA dehydrogenase